MSIQPTSQQYLYGLLRHGETVWNTEKRVQGHENSPLTRNGKNNLEKWAEQLAQGQWQHILSSDLGRVRETVSIINRHLNLPVTEDQRLREQNWGEWEGLKVSEVKENFSEELAFQVKKGWDFCPPGGESRRNVQQRIFTALQDSRENFPEKNFLIICHLGVIKCMIYSIAGRKFMEHEPKLIEKDRMHTVAFQNESYQLQQLNISINN